MSKVQNALRRSGCLKLAMKDSNMFSPTSLALGSEYLRLVV